MEQQKIPPLADGETYIGMISDKDGNAHHIILLPGDNNNAPWKDQIEWAKSIGGDLPNRIEQSMLFAHHHELFQKDWYWSNETYHSDSSFAWYQLFHYGLQGLTHEYDDCRARAVRRLPI